jgi:type VI protein secretion system component Hcp
MLAPLSRSVVLALTGACLLTGAPAHAHGGGEGRGAFVTVETKAGPVPGDSRHKGREQQLTVASLTFEGSAPESGGGGGTGKRSYKPVCWRHDVGRSSAALLRAFVGGEQLPKVVFEVPLASSKGSKDAGPGGEPYELELMGARIISIVHAVSEEGGAEEQICMTFQSYTVRIAGSSVSDSR